MYTRNSAPEVTTLWRHALTENLASSSFNIRSHSEDKLLSTRIHTSRSATVFLGPTNQPTEYISVTFLLHFCNHFLFEGSKNFTISSPVHSARAEMG